MSSNWLVSSLHNQLVLTLMRSYKLVVGQITKIYKNKIFLENIFEKTMLFQFSKTIELFMIANFVVVFLTFCEIFYTYIFGVGILKLFCDCKEACLLVKNGFQHYQYVTGLVQTLYVVLVFILITEKTRLMWNIGRILKLA